LGGCKANGIFITRNKDRFVTLQDYKVYKAVPAGIEMKYFVLRCGNGYAFI